MQPQITLVSLAEQKRSEGGPQLITYRHVNTSKWQLIMKYMCINLSRRLQTMGWSVTLATWKVRNKLVLQKNEDGLCCFQLLLTSSATRCCGWMPVLQLSLLLWKKCEVCYKWKRMTGKLSLLSDRHTTATCPSYPAGIWSKGGSPTSSCRWLWFWTSSASSSSSSGSLHRWVSGTFLCCQDLCWSSSAWSSGYSGTWGTSLCLRRSSTSSNKTYCDCSVRWTEEMVAKPDSFKPGTWWWGGSRQVGLKPQNALIYVTCGFLNSLKDNKSESRQEPGTHLTNPRTPQGDKNLYSTLWLQGENNLCHVACRQQWFPDFAGEENVFLSTFIGRKLFKLQCDYTVFLIYPIVVCVICVDCKFTFIIQHVPVPSCKMDKLLKWVTKLALKWLLFCSLLGVFSMWTSQTGAVAFCLRLF